MRVKIIPRTSGTPAGKLAEAELHFEEGLLSGLKLVGFAVWESRDGEEPNVTLPARQYTVNGERRRYVLLRGTDGAAMVEPLRRHILTAYADHAADRATSKQAHA